MPSERMVCQSSFSTGGLLIQTSKAAESASSTSRAEVSQGLRFLRFHTWKLSSDSSKRQAFVSRLQMLSHQTLGDPWHLSSRKMVQNPLLVSLKELCFMQGHFPAVNRILSLSAERVKFSSCD